MDTMLSLIVTDLATGTRKRIQVSKTPFCIGKAAGNDLILPHESVGARHCQLVVEGDRVQVQDLRVPGGTLLNDRLVETAAPFLAGDRLTVGKFQIERLGDGDAPSPVVPPVPQAPGSSVPPEWTRPVTPRMRQEILDELQKHPDLMKMDFAQTPLEEVRSKATHVIRTLFRRKTGSSAPESLVQELVSEAVGYGPLESLLRDDSVDEIMVNGPSVIYVERQGKIARTDCSFTDEDQLMNILRRILAPIGRRIDQSSPMVDARLPDGSRVNAIIPPLCLIGPVMTIRKFAARPYTIHNLIERGTLTRNMAVFLQLAVRYRRNLLISGGTGSGKTTLLNVFSSFIPEDERIITIEDAAELRLRQPHVIPLEAKPPNIEGQGAIPIRKLLINSLRMRPDRILIGECRGGEALDMLQAMNTGHDGSMTTLHANSARDALNRLETMVLMAGMDLPIRAIRDQIASAIHLLVHQARMPDGSRKIVAVCEITGREGETIVLQDLFRYEKKGLDDDGRVQGDHRALGTVPKFVQDLRARGTPVDLSLFKE
ncbi:MAG: Flp pilus assembly complex ATPase component TadA [Planctomycetes bacterium]|nr:Flp pilus assembly complex ATPase component TadA [Planctomycetota bacterium]